MPIIPLEQQKRGHKIGEIRLGMVIKNSAGKDMPTSIQTFRFTTKWQRVADAIAIQFGGTATPTELANGEKTIEVISTAKEIPVVVPPGEAVITQWRELWGKGYCERRCDGVTEKLSKSPCVCPFDEEERLAAVKAGTACKDTTRLSVMIPDLPGFGVWKVESKGYNAAVEMIDNADLLTAAREKGVYLPATLRLDPRMEKKKRNGKIETLRYVVPVLMVNHSLREIASGQVGSGISAALPSPGALALESGKTSCEDTVPTLEAQHSDDALASPFQRAEIRRRLSELAPPVRAEFDNWIRNERRVGTDAGGLHSFPEQRAHEVPVIMKKIDLLTGQRTPGLWDEDDEVVDAEIVHEGTGS